MKKLYLNIAILVITSHAFASQAPASGDTTGQSQQQVSVYGQLKQDRLNRINARIEAIKRELKSWQNDLPGLQQVVKEHTQPSGEVSFYGQIKKDRLEGINKLISELTQELNSLQSQVPDLEKAIAEHTTTGTTQA